jgi:dienelactone hydrolase
MCTRRCGFLHLVVAALVIASAFLPFDRAAAAPIKFGSGQQVVRIRGLEMRVYTFRPDRCENPSLLLVFHGSDGNASENRDRAQDLAGKFCMLVVAPLFDKQRFPSWRYQHGGITHHHRAQGRQTWTGNFVLGIVNWVRQEEGRHVDYYLFGHSAGGQFLSRVAAYILTEAKRIVIANPSTYVLPSLAVKAPYGLAGLYSSSARTTQLRHYLAQPITILLGQHDVGTKDRSDTPEARAQGRTRYERGLNVFEMAQTVADKYGWPLAWQLIEVPGVGHSSKKMLMPENAGRALGLSGN